MAITLETMKSLLSEAGIKYFIAPDRPAVLMGFTGLHGSYQVIALIELEGRFIQLRTIGYAHCPKGHPHLEAVLRLIGELDYKLRLTKFGWDPTDGEIVCYADLWLEDATLGLQQFRAMLSAYLPGIDVGFGRISKTIETGVDPEGTADTTAPGVGPIAAPDYPVTV